MTYAQGSRTAWLAGRRAEPIKIPAVTLESLQTNVARGLPKVTIPAPVVQGSTAQRPVGEGGDGDQRKKGDPATGSGKPASGFSSETLKPTTGSAASSSSGTVTGSGSGTAAAGTASSSSTPVDPSHGLKASGTPPSPTEDYWIETHNMCCLLYTSPSPRD